MVSKLERHENCTRTDSWRTHCLLSTAFRIAVLKVLSCLICVTELPLLLPTFLLHLSELLSSSLSSSDVLRSIQAKAWGNDQSNDQEFSLARKLVHH